MILTEIVIAVWAMILEEIIILHFRSWSYLMSSYFCFHSSHTGSDTFYQVATSIVRGIVGRVMTSLVTSNLSD